MLAAACFAGSVSAQKEQEHAVPQPEKQAPADWTGAARPPQQLPGERPDDLAGLFAAFAKMPGLSATYTEEKHLALLAVPLTSKGELHFAPPGALARVVTAPERSQLTITDKELRMVDRTGTEVIDLRKSDRVRLFVTSLLQVFRGDATALQQNYDVTFAPLPTTGDAPERAWRLTLQPKHKELQQILQRLDLFGEGIAVTRIELHEPSGDRTVTRITAADPARRFGAEERRLLFGEEAAADGPQQKAGAARTDGSK